MPKILSTEQLQIYLHEEMREKPENPSHPTGWAAKIQLLVRSAAAQEINEHGNNWAGASNLKIGALLLTEQSR